MTTYRPQLSNQALPLTHIIDVIDERGRVNQIEIPGERPLTIYIDKKEVLTLMTLGGAPEALTLGYIRNQRLVNDLEDIESIQVDWETDSVAVKTKVSTESIAKRTEKKTVTSGCGQGTMFGDFMNEFETLELPEHVLLTQDNIEKVVDQIRTHPSVYKKAGSVHACAVFKNQASGPELIYFIEDVGRHNAVDAISGMMWLDGLSGEDLIFYTTGRLTSEMVIKGGQMGIPFLLTRSGVTQMGLSLAKQIKMTIMARCSGEHFLIYEGAKRIQMRTPSAAVQVS
ncbi:MAG: formate dehydrogenase accessory sulfurtransferase FdhD [Betaproteobacteria bacterium]|jgi:FdhD protein